MLDKKIIFSLMTILTLSSCHTRNNTLDGAWQLKLSEEKEVSTTGVMLDFDIKNMRLSGYDGCNNIRGDIYKKETNNYSVSKLISTRMACRTPLHTQVSRKIHALLKEGFEIKEMMDTPKGILLKSANHTLYFLKKKD